MIIQNKAQLLKQKVTVTIVTVGTIKFPFGMCHCTVSSDVGTGDFLLLLGILHVCTHVRRASHDA